MADDKPELKPPLDKSVLPEMAEIEKFVESMLHYNFERLRAFLDEKH